MSIRWCKENANILIGSMFFSLFREINSTYTNEQYKDMFCSVI